MRTSLNKTKSGLQYSVVVVMLVEACLVGFQCNAIGQFAQARHCTLLRATGYIKCNSEGLFVQVGGSASTSRGETVQCGNEAVPSLGRFPATLRAIVH